MGEKFKKKLNKKIKSHFLLSAKAIKKQELRQALVEPVITMKILTLSDVDANELGKKFIDNFIKLEKNHVIIHVSTFYNTIDEYHKALIVYEE